MDVSKFLSKVLGIYLVIIGVAMLVNMHQFASYVSDLVNDKPLMFVSGFFTLILGILMVVSHNIWEWHWRVIISILAWMTLLKGATLIFYPQFIDKSTMLFLKNTNFSYITAIIDFILGALLCYFGFKHKQIQHKNVSSKTSLKK